MVNLKSLIPSLPYSPIPLNKNGQLYTTNFNPISTV